MRQRNNNNDDAGLDVERRAEREDTRETAVEKMTCFNYLGLKKFLSLAVTTLIPLRSFSCFFLAFCNFFISSDCTREKGRGRERNKKKSEKKKRLVKC